MTDNILKIRPVAETRWDCVAFGEVMLRFDPGFGRVRNSRSFQVWEGGGEYNVARAMRKCWGKRAAVVTALPKNDLGWLVEDLISQGGVDMSHVIWRDFDGLGRNTRVGLNFTEKGFGIRAALGCSDRGHSAASQIKPGEFNWEKIFGEEGVRWFHTGGIFAALDSGTSEAVIEAVEVARKYGTIVSYDLNYRASLWKSQGGKAGAQKVNRNIAKYVDVMIGNEEDFTACLGFEVEGLDEHISAIDPANFKKMIATAVREFPNFKVAATTLRNAKTASFNDWSAILWAGDAFYQSMMRENLEIYDRVGGGDGFASGLAYGFLEGKGPQAAVEYGAAHGALAMTTPGDTSMVRVDEVEAVMKGKGARVVR
jgi:2-dehydro-3-deoxygluconokinase